MILKASVLAITTLIVQNTSLASDTPRIGISIGSAYHKAKSKNIVQNAQLGGSRITGQEYTFVKTAPAIGAFVGYDHLISETPLFIGGEAAFVNHNSEKSVESSFGGKSYSLMLKTNNSATGALRIGVVAKDVLIYGKVGLSSTNWKATVKSTSGDKQTKFQKIGYVFGFGFECKMNRNFSFGLEHELTKHNRLRNVHPVVNVKITPTVQITNLRLIYSF